MVSTRAWFELVMQESVKKNPSLPRYLAHLSTHVHLSLRDGQSRFEDRARACRPQGHQDGLAPAHKLAAVDRLAEYRREQEKAKIQEATNLTFAAA
jgi:hypothetical protein